MRVLVRSLAIALWVAAAGPTYAEALPFQKDDRVTFIGDSITHGGTYHENIYLFYATRFPDQPFSIFNGGISGDTTPGTNLRLDTDILPDHPNVATIMLGMNDAWAWCFGSGEPTEKMLQGRENAYDTYTREMTMLADALTKAGVRIIFIKPSIYDETALLETPPLVGKNDLLAKYGEFLETLASKHDAGMVDFHGYLRELNARLQKDDPSRTVIGRDRVHPGDPGHFVMSYLFLKAQNMPKWISAIHLDAGAGKITETKNCSIASGAEVSAERIAFTCTEKALPFPITAGQKPALQWVPFQQELNQQLLTVERLPSGSYELKVDDSPVGSYTGDQLAAGVDLSDNPATPQYAQALKVKAANSERAAIAAKLRAVAHVRHTILRRLKPAVSEDDADALKAALEAPPGGGNGAPWSAYLQTQIQVFLANYRNVDSLKKQEEEAMRRIWTVNQPQPHRWTLTRAVGSGDGETASAQ